MTILCFYDEEACQLGLLTNRVPEIGAETGWKVANSQAGARRALAGGVPERVRLRISDRVFLEDVLKCSIPVGTVLADYLNTLDLSALNADQRKAIDAFKEITS